MEDPTRERTTTAEELDLLKGKYKKSLQELMHILKVNKSLKDCLDTQTNSLEETLANRQKESEQRYQKEVEAYQGELQQYKDLLLGERMQKEHIQQQLKEREELLAQARSQCQSLENHLQQVQSSPAQPIQSQTLRTKLAGYFQLSRVKDQLWEECQQLKQRVSQLTLQLIQQRQRYRSDIFSKETEILKSKESEYEKLRTIQSKYQLLESELNNYKTVEKYFEEEANSLFDQDTVYNGIRQQISRINEDFSKYQLQSSQLLLRKREEEAEKNRKIAELERQVSRLKLIQEKNLLRQREIESERCEYLSLKQKMKQIQSQRDQQLQKNEVLQALTITDKHRVSSTISERIKQFETRIKLLLEEGNLTQTHTQSQSLQQIVILKGYVKELSELLRQSKKREEHLAKKYQQYKYKFSSAQEAYKAKIAQFKAKIKDYDVLVGKLYTALQQKLKQRMPIELQKEFNTAIAHYEQKMVQMSEQIISLRARITELQNGQQGAVEAENQTYKQIISELSVRVNELQQVVNKRDQRQPQPQQKDKLIESLAKQVSTLKAIVGQNRQKEAISIQTIQNYERRVARYREQLQQKQRISTNLTRNSIDTASLIEKVNYLEYELTKSKNTKTQPTPRPDQFIKSLESKLSAQNQLLTEYKAQIDRLYAQRKTEKTLKHSSAVDQYSQISQLQQQIGEWQIRVLSLEKELHNRQSRFKDEVQSLKLQNRALMEQLNSKHTQMMGYYQQLSRKNEFETALSRVPEMERYITQLQQKNNEIIQRSSYEANQLNASILALRTANLSLRNELQSKEDVVNELKHQLFNAELRSQKEKPITASMIASFSASFTRDTQADRQKQRQKEKLLTTLVLLAAEAQSLRLKNLQLEAMYHQDLDKYRQALKQLQTRQMELCNSLQLSSEVHQPREVQSHTQISQQAISHLSQNSTQYLPEPHPPQTIIRSQEHPQVQTITSNPSIEGSPLRRRGVTVKKIG